MTQKHLQEAETGPLDSENIVLADVIDAPAFQEMMDDYYALTGIGIGIIDLKGEVLVSTGWQDICVKFHRAQPESCAFCHESDIFLSRGVVPGAFKIYRCKNNLWDIATPIMLGDRHIGNIFLGQFLYDDEEPDYELFRAQARRFGYDETAYIAALNRVSRFSRQTVQTAMSYYSKLAQMISRSNFNNVVLKDAMSERKRLQAILQKQLAVLTQPLNDAVGIQFSDLFNIDELQHIQDAFAEATGVASIITTPDGIPITRPSNFCRLCSEIIRTSEKGLANCIKSDTALGKCNPSGPIVQPCMSGGLWDGGASITVGGRHIANWLIGQVRNEEQDETKMVEYADEIGVDRELFRSALSEVPTMSKERFDKVALALYLLANELSQKAYQNVQQARFITERKKIEKDLQQKNAELERFTYTVSHDLKSPLITIKGFAGALLNDLQEGRYERMAGDLKRVCEAADKMNDLLRDLLELSTIGRLINPPESVDMNLLAEEVLAKLAGPLKNHNVTIFVQPDLPHIFCDRRRMEEVVQILAENAINYMGDQAEPCIQFGMRAEADTHVFFLQDNGIGIDEKYNQVIFGLFNKLDAKSRGTGIGLALVKRIIEVQGGNVWVESNGLGTGSRFCFTVGKKWNG